MKKIIELVENFYNGLGFFVWSIKEWGLKTALDNFLIGFTKWFLQAKRIQITYFKKKNG